MLLSHQRAQPGDNVGMIGSDVVRFCWVVRQVIQLDLSRRLIFRGGGWIQVRSDRFEIAHAYALLPGVPGRLAIEEWARWLIGSAEKCRREADAVDIGRLRFL